MPTTTSHPHPAAIRPSLSTMGRLRFSALAALALLSFGGAAPLGAQTLDYVQHISVDFAHDTVLNTNISLYYRNAFGGLQAPPTEADNPHFYLFSTKGMSFLSYDSTGAIYKGVGTDSFGWVPTILYVGVNVTSSSEVSYTPITTVHIGPNISDNYLEDIAFMTGARNALYKYDLTTRTRWESPNTLNTDSSPSPYSPGKALLATGFYTSLVTSNGGIYLADTRNRDPVTGLQLTPLITAPGSGPGELTNPSAMTVGPDGMLYVLDYGLDETGTPTGVNRIEKFDLATGAYISQFLLPDGVTVFSTSLAIGPDGHLYLGDGLGGGSVFSSDGVLLSTFHPPAPDASWVDGGLIPDGFGNTSVGVGSFLQYDGRGNILTYVEGQGINMYRDPSFVAVPEPSTWALLGLGLAALVVRYRARRLS